MIINLSKYEMGDLIFYACFFVLVYILLLWAYYGNIAQQESNSSRFVQSAFEYDLVSLVNSNSNGTSEHLHAAH